MLKEYGYVRVSTKEQNIDRQMSAMDEVGIIRKHIYIDKLSGKDFNRPQYQKLIKRIRSGDVIFIKSIDRLGRDYDEIIEQWRYITKTKDADIVVIDFPLLDTRNTINEVTGKFISDMVLQILSYVAQVERENIKQRQAEGIKEAKIKGIRFGRPKLNIPDDFERIYIRWKNKEVSLRTAAKLLDTNPTTLSRWIKEKE